MNTNTLYLVLFPILWAALFADLTIYLPVGMQFLPAISMPGWFVWGWKLSEAVHG